MSDTTEPKTHQRLTQTSRDEVLRILQKCHAGDIDDFLAEVCQKKKTDEPSTTMSNTPETDGHLRRNTGNGSEWVRADFARKLERERDQAQRDLQQLLESIKVTEVSIQMVDGIARPIPWAGDGEAWRGCAERLAASVRQLMTSQSQRNQLLAELALVEFEELEKTRK
jgi:hypothetical protein